MIINYCKVAWRNIVKYKFNSLLNIIGLSVGITFAMLIAAYVWMELRVNSELKNAGNQYIIQSKWKDPEMGIPFTTIGALPKALRENYPGLVADFYRFDGLTCIVSSGNTVFEENVALGDSTLLQMYGFRLLYGNSAAAFYNPGSVILTEEKALKYFGRTDIVGETLTFKNFRSEKQEFKITAVLEQIPESSVTSLNGSNQNQFFVSLKDAVFFGRDVEGWNNPWIAGFIELQPGVKPEMLNQPMQQLLRKNSPESISSNLQPYAESLSGYNIMQNNGIVRRMLYALSLIAVFILLMAVVNFISITINTSASRLKEIGLRKVLGSRRKELIMLFLTESVLLVVISTFIATGWYILIRPLFSSVLGKEVPAISSFPVIFIAFPIGLAGLTGLLAGIYPALKLSSVKIAESIKGKLANNFSKARLRKILVGFQFCTALVVFISSVIISRQVSFFLNKNLGYDKEYVVSVKTPRDWSAEGLARMETIRQEFSRMPEMENVSLSYEIPGTGTYFNYTVSRQGQDQINGISLQALCTDEHFAATYKIPVVAGDFFRSSGETVQPSDVVINETAARALGWQNINAAVGQLINLKDSTDPYKITGVVKDYYVSSAHSKISPMIWLNSKALNVYRYFSFRLKPGNISESMRAAENKWASLMPGTPFEYVFNDDTLKRLYKTEVQLKKASVLAAVLAVLIVFLGITAMLSLSIKQRTKEISIRKVMGATVTQIILLFIKDFWKIFIISFAVAAPVAWFIMHRWLSDYYSRIAITIEPFIGSMLLLGLMAGLLIALQSLKAALSKPADCLRNE